MTGLICTSTWITTDSESFFPSKYGHQCIFFIIISFIKQHLKLMVIPENGTQFCLLNFWQLINHISIFNYYAVIFKEKWRNVTDCWELQNSMWFQDIKIVWGWIFFYIFRVDIFNNILGKDDPINHKRQIYSDKMMKFYLKTLPRQVLWRPSW